MFQGEFVHKLDEKNRIIIPAKFRLFILYETDKLGFFLTVNPIIEERCIRMYTRTEWDKISTNLKQFAQKTPDPDSFRRLFYTHSEFVEMDAQYRLVLPQRLIDYAGLEKKKDIISVGCTNHIQLWNVEHWKKTVEQDKQRLKEFKISYDDIFGG